MKGLSIKTLQCGGLKNYESLTAEEIEILRKQIGKSASFSLTCDATQKLFT